MLIRSEKLYKMDTRFERIQLLMVCRITAAVQRPSCKLVDERKMAK